jgi:type IV fimbrial biogenesis protein FimT
MKYRLQRPNSHHGLTLIEILVVLAVVAVVLAVATPSLSGFLERRRVVAAANEVASVIHYARSEPNVIGDGVFLLFGHDPAEKISCVAVTTQYRTSTCSCHETPVCTGEDATLLRLYQIPNASGTSFETTAKSWGTYKKYRLVFSRNQFVTDASDVEVTVKGAKSGAMLRLEINSVGRVRICSPNDSISGYGICKNPVEPSS